MRIEDELNNPKAKTNHPVEGDTQGVAFSKREIVGVKTEDEPTKTTSEGVKSSAEESKQESSSVKESVKTVTKEPYQPWGDILDYNKLKEDEEAEHKKKLDREKRIRNYTMLGEALRNIGEGIGVAKGAHQEKRDVKFGDNYIKALKDLEADHAQKLAQLRKDEQSDKALMYQRAEREEEKKYRADKDKQAQENFEEKLKAEYDWKKNQLIGKKDDSERGAAVKREGIAAGTERARIAANAGIEKAKIAAAAGEKKAVINASKKSGAGGGKTAPGTVNYADGKGNYYTDVPISDISLMAGSYLKDLRARASNISLGTDYLNAKKELELLQKSPEYKALEALANGKIDGTEQELTGAISLVWNKEVHEVNKKARDGTATDKWAYKGGGQVQPEPPKPEEPAEDGEWTYGGHKQPNPQQLTDDDTQKVDKHFRELTRSGDKAQIEANFDYWVNLRGGYVDQLKTLQNTDEEKRRILETLKASIISGETKL